MSLLEQFQDRLEKKPTDPAMKILFAIFDDLLGRKGFDGVWDSIDPEDQEEILGAHLDIIKKNLP